MAAPARWVDVSVYQGAFDFHAAKAAGVVGVLLRATMGHMDVDVDLARDVQAARAAGLKLGFYHFAYPNLNRAEDEANHFVSVVLPLLQDNDVVALDFETAPFSELWARDWLEIVEKATERRPLFYSYLAAIQAARFSSRMARYPLWLADYTTTLPAAPAPWSVISVWQAADRNGVPGRSVDLDWVYQVPAVVRHKPEPKVDHFWITYRAKDGTVQKATTKHPARWAIRHSMAFRRGRVTIHRVMAP